MHQAWDALIPSLQAGNFDVMHGAMSITDERKQQLDFSQAYMFPTANIVASANSQLSVIGTQIGTTFPQYLTANFPNATVKTYGSMQEAFSDLVAGRVDAVMGESFLLDIWLAEGNNGERYQFIGEPIFDPHYFGEGHGFAVKKGNVLLLAELNQAIDILRATGKLDEIYQQHFGEIKPVEIGNFTGLLTKGAWVTFQLAFFALVIGLILGLLAGLAENSRRKWLHYPVFAITSLLRGLPELLVIFFVYFSSSYLLQHYFNNSFEINAFMAGTIALSLIFTGYASQVFKAARQAIPRGQFYASEAYGLSHWHCFSRITLPQLMRHALPGLGNLWQVLLKDTALVSLIGVADIMANAQIAANASRQPFTYFMMAAILYLVLTTLSQLIFNYFNYRANRHLKVEQ